MLRLTLIWVDKTKEPWLRTGIGLYLSRLRRYLEVTVKEVKGCPHLPRSDPKKILEFEAAAIRKAIPRGAATIALHENGRGLDSPGLAWLLTAAETKGVRDLAMITGGPSGLNEDLIKNSDDRLSLSLMTFTHEMARLILLEQLYRACTIRAGWPYHH